MLSDFAITIGVLQVGKEGEEREAILYVEVLEQLRLPQAGTLLPLTEAKVRGLFHSSFPGHCKARHVLPVPFDEVNLESKLVESHSRA